MNDSTVDELCACGSGLNYDTCCGVPGPAVDAAIRAKVTLQGVESDGTLTPQIREAIQAADTSANLFIARLNIFENRAYFIKMSPGRYRESVFLDPARIAGKYIVESDMRWLAQIADKTPWQPSAYIFHGAFCGSTLMSQALGAVFDCLALREPEVLNNIMYYIRRPEVEEKDKQAWFTRVMHLVSRRYDGSQGVVVKTNDYSNPLMLDMLEWRDDIPILFMYTPLSQFLAGCLKAPNRCDWIAGRYRAVRAAASRWLNMAENFSVEEGAVGQMAAVYWSYNIALYLQAQRSAADRVRCLDFNDMLVHPLRSVEACGRLFALRPFPGVSAEAEIEKLFGVYSKNSDLKYSPQQRSDDIDKLLGENPAELEAAQRLALRLLGGDYPQKGLPGSLLG